MSMPKLTRPRRITVTFVPQRADGTPGAAITFCWDLPTQAAG